MPRPKIRILFITCFGDFHGGGQRSLYLLLKYLDKDAFEPVLMVPAEGALKKEAEALGVRVIVHSFPRIRSLRFVRAWRQGCGLLGFLRKERINLICVDSTRETFYAGVVGKVARVPVLLHVRVTDSRPWVDRWLYFFSDALIAVSRASAERFARLDTKKKVVVVYNGIELGPLPSRQGGPGEALKIGYFGRVEHRKGLDIFIKALDILKDARLEGHIFGAGDPAYVDALKKMPGSDRVVFHGFLNDAAPAMASMDAVILPSRYGEGLSRSIIEAMALGTPVIASDTPSNPEALGGILREFIFSGEDAEDLARVLAMIRDDRSVLDKARALARARAEEAFDIKKNTRAIEGVYRACADIHTILVVNLGGIGDLLLSMPAVRAIKACYPSAEVTLLAVGRVCEFARAFHFFDDVAVWPGFDDARRRFDLLRVEKVFVMLSLLREKRFDLAINMRTIVSRKSSWKMALLFFWINARRRAGRDTDGRGFFFDIKVPETRLGEKHEMEYDLDLARALGADIGDGRFFGLDVSSGIAQRVARDLEKCGVGPGDILLGIHLGGMASRRWPVVEYGAALKAIQEQRPCKIVVTGGPGEEKFFDALKDAGVGGLINRINRLSWPELSALISLCRLFISNDTGPMHIAAALGVPQVVVFGGGYLTRFDPRQINPKAVVLNRQVLCAPCDRVRCSSLACLREISPDEVARAAGQLLDARV